MRIAMIGTGYVGLVSGACFADFGHEVVCIDKDASKIDQLNRGEIPIFEPGLDVLVNGNRFAGRLSFTTDLAEGMKGAQAIFIAVGTPSRRGDGHADLSYVYAASEEIADQLEDYTVIVTKSTVPVGTGDKIEELIRKRRPDADFDVASNPEFLREGSAIEDFKRPDRVVVGAETERAFDVLRQLYRPLNLNETPMLCTQRRTSELTKYAANAFLATKITFINEIADLCESVGADVQQVAKGIGLDGRIGSKFLHAGPGYGGSCFPKDTLALLKTAEDFASPMNIVKATVETNNNRKIQMAQKVLNAVGNVKGKKLAILGVTFKPNTDDMRDAPSLDIIPALQKAGALVHAYDPEGMEEAKPLLPGVFWETNAQDTLRNAEALVILTEWNEFRALDLGQIKEMLARPLIIDLRNIYAIREMQNAGLTYHSIGRPAI
ncbi:MAG: UDP-glucose/GDP-mannose dehydrogenase family protein [Parvibaculaceae bacterium]|nr:UDP-glucose/GDP-mannose dehydrogenase family protein [Parvibaculaceae bacterium]